jgi:hypothetical protein
MLKYLVMALTYIMTILFIEPNLGAKPKRSIIRAEEQQEEKKEDEEDESLGLA